MACNRQVAEAAEHASTDLISGADREVRTLAGTCTSADITEGDARDTGAHGVEEENVSFDDHATLYDDGEQQVKATPEGIKQLAEENRQDDDEFASLSGTVELTGVDESSVSTMQEVSDKVMQAHEESGIEPTNRTIKKTLGQLEEDVEATASGGDAGVDTTSDSDSTERDTTGDTSGTEGGTSGDGETGPPIEFGDMALSNPEPHVIKGKTSVINRTESNVSAKVTLDNKEIDTLDIPPRTEANIPITMDKVKGGKRKVKVEETQSGKSVSKTVDVESARQGQKEPPGGGEPTGRASVGGGLLDNFTTTQKLLGAAVLGIGTVVVASDEPNKQAFRRRFVPTGGGNRRQGSSKNKTNNRSES